MKTHHFGQRSGLVPLWLFAILVLSKVLIDLNAKLGRRGRKGVTWPTFWILGPLRG